MTFSYITGIVNICGLMASRCDELSDREVTFSSPLPCRFCSVCSSSTVEDVNSMLQVAIAFLGPNCACAACRAAVGFQMTATDTARTDAHQKTLPFCFREGVFHTCGLQLKHSPICE